MDTISPKILCQPMLPRHLLYICTVIARNLHREFFRTESVPSVGWPRLRLINSESCVATGKFASMRTVQFVKLLVTASPQDAGIFNDWINDYR